jgi:RHS repeat-associated protein
VGIAGEGDLMVMRRSWVAALFALLTSSLLSIPASADMLTVVKTGSGAGTVTGSVGNIDCGLACSDTYTANTSITLTATPSAGSQFTGWLGPCTGTGSCTFNIGGNVSALATFAPLQIGAPSLDIDGTNTYNALTDGLLILRHLFGLTGPTLISNAVGPNAARETSPEIVGYMTDVRPALDIDGNGQVDALSDGLLIIRYLFGLRGPSLIAGAISPGAIRTSPDAIEGRLSSLSPPVSGLPPDPSAVAPAVNLTVATGMFEATAFLYTGANSIQTGVLPGTIDARRVAVLRGRVQNRDGTPLSGVTITILAHPELGQTMTRADGAFDLAVNGGGSLTVNYQKAGFLTAQRMVTAPWREYAWLPDVVMIPYDTAVTTINLATAGMKTARGSPVSDADGDRRATVLFPSGTTAIMKLPGGATQPLSTLSVRATEYTIGPTGPKAMPAQLPPSSGYTYAAELSIDEAIAAGATDVTFSQPLPTYVENFLGFPVGGAVPSGYYDRQQGQWIASANGRVIEVLTINGSLADLDIDGDAIADDAAKLAVIGITADERTRLAQLYEPGQTLWRVPVTHFTPWDYNWPIGPPPDSEPPPPPIIEPPIEKEDEACGSIIGCQNQTLGQAIAITGTPFSLHYKSNRAPGRKDAFVVRVPVSGASVPASLQGIRVRVSVAGRLYQQDFPPAPNLSHTVMWDGKDAYGRPLSGAQIASVQVIYDYTGQYYAAKSDFQNSFGRAEAAGAVVTANRAASTIAISRNSTVTVGIWDARNSGLGNWTLNVHHAYDPGARTLQLGGGRRRSAESIAGVITTVAGNGVLGSDGDDGLAIEAKLALPDGIAVGADGSVFIADAAASRVRRVAPSGVITTVAGNGLIGSGGDGGLATAAQLFQPHGIAIGGDGSLFIADAGNHRIRRVRPDGIIVTVAGSGVQGFEGDGGPATSAKLFQPFGVATATDGSLFIADTANSRIRRVGPDGVITTIAGTGDSDFGGDGGPATAAFLSFPQHLAVAPDGSLYVTDAFNNRIRRVAPDGVITTAAGTGTSGFSGDGGPATLAQLVPASIAVGRDGSLFISDAGNHRIRRVAADGIITTWAGSSSSGFFGDSGLAKAAMLKDPTGLATGPDGSLYLGDAGNFRVRRVALALPGFSATDLLLPSEDGRQVYLFNSAGRHLTTRDALTAAVRYQFGYDASGRVISVTDVAGNVTTIARTGGVPTAVVAPGGQTTTLSVSNEGWLLGAANPAGATVAMSYSTDGLLESIADPRNFVHTMMYDALGRLVQDADPAGGSTTLTRTEQSNGYTVTTTSALGRTRSYQVEQLPTGAIRRSLTAPSGHKFERTIDADGTELSTAPNGGSTSVTFVPDPRFGMLAPRPGSVIVKTPNGLTRTFTSSRTVSLSDPNDALSLTSLTDTASDNGAIGTSVYTSNGTTRTITKTSAVGRSSMVTLDSLGRVIKVQSPGLEPISYAYNGFGMVATAIEGSGGASRTMSFAYNGKHELSSMTDAAGRTMGIAYDIAGRPVTLTLADGRTIHYAYDAAGNVTAVTPPGRPAHGFGYTPIDQTASYTAPDLGGGSTVTQYTYNTDRALTRKSLPDGNMVDLTFDAAGRTSGIDIARGAIAHSYDMASGRLTGVTAPGGLVLAYAYDGALVTGVTRTGAVAGTAAYTYDNAWRIASESVNAANIASFSYDADDFLTMAGSLALTHDVQNGLLIGSTLGGITDTRAYNGFGELTGYVANHGGTPFYNVSYVRDAIGRITQKVETIGGSTNTYGYSYDLAGRLDSVTENATPHSTFAYDSNDNRIASTGPGGAASAMYDAQDRLLSYGGNTYAYNANGELLSKTASGQTTSYQYDEFRNLLKVTLPGGPVIDYLIDGGNRRIGKKVNGVLVQSFLYRGALRPIAELDGANALVSRFVYATRVNVPDYMVKGGVTYRIVTDHLGSPRLVVNAASGTVAQRVDYDEFGQVLNDTNPGFQPFGFAGGLYDPDTKLVRFGARDYDAQSGRWTSKDSVTRSGSNQYVYANGDPVGHSDLSGMWSDRTHRAFIDELATHTVFVDPDPDLINAINEGSLDIDHHWQNQVLPGKAALHAMRDKGQSVEDARRSACEAMKAGRDKFLAGKDSPNATTRREAYFALGQALHTVMDSTSPVHQNFPIWRMVQDGINHGDMPHSKENPDYPSKAVMEKTVQKMLDFVQSGDCDCL